MGFFLAAPPNLSSPIKDTEPVTPAMEAQSSNHWIAREFPRQCLELPIPGDDKKQINFLSASF